MRYSTTFLLILTASFIATAPAQADQLGKLNGGYVGGFFDITSTTVKVKANTDEASGKFDGLGQQGVNAHLTGGYSFGITDRFSLDTGVTYTLLKNRLLSIDYSDNSSASFHGKIEEKNHFSIFVAPGFLNRPDFRGGRLV